MTSNTFQAIVLTLTIVLTGVISLMAAIYRRRIGLDASQPPVFGYLILGLLLAVLLIFYWDDALAPDPYDRIIRAQFNLPDDVELGRVQRVPRTPACWLDDVYYRMTVQFSPDQFERYAAVVDDPSRWQSIDHTHFGANAGFAIDGDALAWSQLPEPPSLGSQQAVWRVANADVRHGKAFCFDLHRSGGSPSDGIDYTVTPCNARAKDQQPPQGGGHVEAALDSDKRRLNLYMRFRSKPAYCNNRSMNALNRLLGSMEWWQRRDSQ